MYVLQMAACIPALSATHADSWAVEVRLKCQPVGMPSQQPYVLGERLTVVGASYPRAQESGRLQAVLANPQFRADPIAAITKHLQATLPPVPAPQPSSASSGSKRQRRRGKAASSMMEQ